MTVEIRSVAEVENPAGLRQLVREYLAHELVELKAVSGLDYALEPLIEATFDHLGDYLPPLGACIWPAVATGN